MRVSIYTLIAAATAVSAQSATPTSFANAPETTDNVKGTSFVATLPAKAGKPQGSVVGTSSPDGKGVEFAVAISGLPAEGGPFLYHIHEKPVPTDGNCTGTGAHLDPFKRGETPPCDKTAKQQCQTGDLSGKYGTLNTPGGSAGYLDLYTSTNPSDVSYFGNLSVVVHFANKTRITCANFSAIGASPVPSSGFALPTGGSGGNGTVPVGPSGTGSSPEGPASTYNPPSPTQPSPSGSTGGAGRVMVAGAGVLAAAAALVL